MDKKTIGSVVTFRELKGMELKMHRKYNKACSCDESDLTVGGVGVIIEEFHTDAKRGRKKKAFKILWQVMPNHKLAGMYYTVSSMSFDVLATKTLHPGQVSKVHARNVVLLSSKEIKKSKETS